MAFGVKFNGFTMEEKEMFHYFVIPAQACLQQADGNPV
jgi:hypothetical protein